MWNPQAQRIADETAGDAEVDPVGSPLPAGQARSLLERIGELLGRSTKKVGEGSTPEEGVSDGR